MPENFSFSFDLPNLQHWPRGLPPGPEGPGAE